jgi:DNA ligase-1
LGAPGGGRSHDLLKVKVFTDDEALVIGHEGGLGKYAGRVGALRCVLRSGAEFSCGSGLSDAQRVAPPALGTVVSVKFFELTRDGVPRFPVLLRVRGDVSAAEFKR